MDARDGITSLDLVVVDELQPRAAERSVGVELQLVVRQFVPPCKEEVLDRLEPAGDLVEVLARKATLPLDQSAERQQEQVLQVEGCRAKLAVEEDSVRGNGVGRAGHRYVALDGTEGSIAIDAVENARGCRTDYPVGAVGRAANDVAGLDIDKLACHLRFPLSDIIRCVVLY